MPLNWDKLSVWLVSANRILCEPGWRLAPDWAQRLEDLDLWYVFKGRGVMQLADERVDLRPGVCFWMRPGGIYLSDQDPDDRLGVNALHFELVDPAGVHHRDARGVEAASLGRLPRERHVVSDSGYGDSVLRRVVELARPPLASDPAARRVAQTLLTGLLMDLDVQSSSPTASALSGTERRHHELIAEAAARIDESPGDCPAIGELARRAGYSVDHFARVFKQRMGLSPQDYLVRARIDRAHHLLHESGLSISEIASVLGYADVYFFSRQFKQKTGRTPSAYRRQPSVA